MEVQNLFTNSDELTIENYFMKMGINDVNSFLYPSKKNVEDGLLYDNMYILVQYLKEFLLPTDVHFIVQDCDADGLFSAALLYIGLIKYGVSKDNIKILFHNDKRHGLNEDIMAQIGSDCKFLWLPDANVVEEENALKMQNKGITVIALDHHQTPNFKNVITINNQLSNSIKNKSLCGTGIVYKFLEQIVDISDYRCFVAFANVADVMDMRSLENRWFSTYLFQSRSVLLLRQMWDKWGGNDTLTNTSVAWKIIPKINAVQRSDGNNLKLLLFKALVGEVDNIEEILKLVEKSYREQSKIVTNLSDNLKIYDWGTVCIGVGETSNYSGLIANKLQSKFNKSAMCLTKIADSYIGSCRSPYALRDYCVKSNLFNFAAGHKSAFGVSIDKKNIRSLHKYFQENLPKAEPKIVCATYDVLESFPKDFMFIEFDPFGKNREYWGQGISEPEFYFTNIKINSSQIQVIGKNKTTIKFNYNGVDFIQFFVSNTQKEKYHIGENIELNISLIGNLTINTYNDNMIPQVQIKEMERKTKI